MGRALVKYSINQVLLHRRRAHPEIGSTPVYGASADVVTGTQLPSLRA